MTAPKGNEGHGQAGDGGNQLSRIIGAKAKRRLRARSRRNTSVWLALGMYGVVGWSIVLPILIGIAVGLALDAIVPAGFSWALSGLFVGLILGLHSAWQWVSQQMVDDSHDGEGDAD